MGQTIILDKSAFRSLSPEEIRLLFNRYAVVVTPVLLMEVLADIKKSKEEDWQHLVKPPLPLKTLADVLKDSPRYFFEILE